jgi:hypothetical protein
MKVSVRSVPLELEKVAAFDGKENDAAEVTNAVMSSMPSLGKWVEVEGSKEQHDYSEKQCAIIDGEILFEWRADDLSQDDWWTRLRCKKTHSDSQLDERLWALCG